MPMHWPDGPESEHRRDSEDDDIASPGLLAALIGILAAIALCIIAAAILAGWVLISGAVFIFERLSP